MTSILSSQGGNAAYANALAQLLARQTADANAPTASGPAAAQASPQPSLASVLSSDDTTGVSAQANSSITSLMMEIQALKSGTASDPAADASANGSGSADASASQSATVQQADPQQAGAVKGHHHHHGDGAAEAKMFSRIDADGSGSVSLAEFVAGRPKGMSEEDATTIFKSIDAAGAGSVTEEQFAASLKREHETQSAHQAGGAGDMSQADMQALAQDIVQQLTQVIQNFNNGYVDSSAYEAADTSTVATGQ